MKVTIFYVLLLMSFLLGFLAGRGDRLVSNANGYKTIKLMYSLKNTTSEPLVDVDFVTFLPGLGDPEVVNLSTDHKYSIRDLQGNIRLTIKKDVIGPYFSTDILVASIVDVDEQYSLLKHIRKPVPPEVLPQILALSQEVATIDANYVRAVSLWVSSNIRQNQYNPHLQSISRTLDSRAGDCTDMAVLAIQLLAVKGIRSIMVGGFVVSGESELVSARDYHNWLYFYSENKWQLMDPSAGLLVEKHTDYIPFDLVSNQLDYQRFSTNYPEIELRLK